MQKILNKQSKAAQRRDDCQSSKISFYEYDPQKQRLSAPSQAKQDSGLQQAPSKNIFLRYCKSLGLLIFLSVLLVSFIIYESRQIPANKNTQRENVTDESHKQKQPKYIQQNLDTRKVVQASQVNSGDRDINNIQKDEKQQENSAEMQIFLNNQKTLLKNGKSVTKNKEEFNINTQVWKFQKQSPNYLEELMAANNKIFAQISNFKINIINTSNYQIYLSEEANRKLENTLGILKERMNKDKDKELSRKFGSIKQRLILFSILYERGGVIIDGSLTLTENFDWVRQINDNIYVNRGNPGAQPQVVGFYSPYFSSAIRKQKKYLQLGMEDVQKYMVLMPAMENYFVAAKEGAAFIGRLLDQMMDILVFPDSVSKDVQENKYQYINLYIQDIYYQYFFLAGHRVLQTKQLEIDRDNNNHNIRNFAIDYYGLFLINCYYGPYKLSVIFQDEYPRIPARKIQNFARYDMEEFQANVGPMRYLHITTIFQQLNEFLTQVRDNEMEKQIMKGSYLQKMYFPQATEPFIYDSPEKKIINQKLLPWNSLAKIIWVYWDAGIANGSFDTFLFVENLKKTSLNSGFEFKEVNNGNLKDYIDAATLQRIQLALKNSKMNIYRQTKSDLIRLALLYKYGGVYVDASVIAVQNFDWLVNIAKVPSQYIFNRYGELPSVLMFWNPNAGGLLQWEVDQVANTKQGWAYSFENSIIVSIKKSEFIKEWLDLFLQLLMKTPTEVLTVFQQCKIQKFKWVNEADHYLLAMDSAKCLIGRRQAWINKQNKTEWKNGMAYYKLWSMTTYFGPFKIRSNTNYANLERYGNNPFFTRYSQEYVEGITGKMHFLLKFVQQSRAAIHQFIQENYDILKEETHSQSLFMKYFYNEEYGRFEKTGNMIVLIKSPK